MTLVIREIGNSRYVYDQIKEGGHTKSIYLGKVGDEKTEQRVADRGSERRFQAQERSQVQEEGPGFVEEMNQKGIMGYFIDKGRKTLSQKKEEPIDEPSGFKPRSSSMNLDMPQED